MKRQVRFALIASLLIVPSSMARSVPADDVSTFSENIDVNVINVEVFVVDQEGRRVVGMTRDDFELYEDGKPVDISNFYAISRADRVAASLSDGIGSLAPLPEVPDERQLNLVVYVDDFNILPSHRTRVIADLEGFLEDRAFQGDNVMLVVFDRKLEVTQPFTRDREQIRDSLERIARRSGTHRAAQQAELRQTMISLNFFADGTDTSRETLQIGSGGGNLKSAYDFLRSYVEKARSDVKTSVEGLQEMVRALAGLPGRKALLYVGDGLPQRPAEVLYQHFADAFGPAAIRDAAGRGDIFDPFLENLQEDETPLFNSIIREANSQQITLYTLDAAGGEGSGLGASAAASDLSRNAGGQSVLASLESQNLQEPLVALAVGTGGSSILNTRNFGDALADLAEDFDTFYSLGYQAPDAGDGAYHRIEVRTKRPGLAVRHRRGYVDKPQIDRIGDRTLAALYLHMEANPLGVSLDFGRPKREKRGNFKLPLLVRIPLREVTLLADGAQQHGELEIFVVVEDEHGRSTLHRIPYPIDLPRARLAKAMQQDIGYGLTLEIRAGLPTVAVGVWDRLGGEQSYVRKQVIVEERKDSR